MRRRMYRPVPLLDLWEALGWTVGLATAGVSYIADGQVLGGWVIVACSAVAARIAVEAWRFRRFHPGLPAATKRFRSAVRALTPRVTYVDDDGNVFIRRNLPYLPGLSSTVVLYRLSIDDLDAARDALDAGEVADSVSESFEIRNDAVVFHLLHGGRYRRLPDGSLRWADRRGVGQFLGTMWRRHRSLRAGLLVATVADLDEVVELLRNTRPVS